MSTLPKSFGAQNEWITSFEKRFTEIERPTGTCISFAVVKPYSGYSNSNHHCWAVASMTSEPSGGSPVISRMELKVGTAMITTISTGISVQTISRRVLPWNCFASRPGRSRKTMLKTSTIPRITTKTMPANQKISV